MFRLSELKNHNKLIKVTKVKIKTFLSHWSLKRLYSVSDCLASFAFVASVASVSYNAVKHW